MNKDRNRLMQSLFLPAAELIRQPNWLPAVDVYQIANGYLVKVDLAGVRPEDFQLTIQGSTVTVEGTRRDCHVEEGCYHVLLEIAYNHFERSITLPDCLDGMRVTTAHDHGMLLIRIQREGGQPIMTPIAAPSPVLTLLTLPTLPLKNTVLFPNLFMPLSVGRTNSLAAVEAVLATEEKTVLIVAQREEGNDQPRLADLYNVGTRAVIRKMARTPAGIEILVQGMERFRLEQMVQEEPYLKISGTILPYPADQGVEVEALHRLIIELARKALELIRSDTPIDINQLVAQAGDPLRLSYLLGSLLSLDVPREQALLEASTQLEALQLVHTYLAHEVQVLELRSQISNKAQTEMSREQRNYMLRQQLSAIQEELGETNPEKADVDNLRKRLTEADLPADIRTQAQRELGRLERLPAASPEYQVIRSYLELIPILFGTRVPELF